MVTTRPLHLDPFKDHGKLHSTDRTLMVLAMKPSTFQALVPDGKARSIPPQGLHLVPTAIEEHEDLA